MVFFLRCSNDWINTHMDESLCKRYNSLFTEASALTWWFFNDERTSAPGDFDVPQILVGEVWSDFFPKSTLTDGVVLPLTCWVMVREVGVLRGDVDSSQNLGFCLQQHSFCDFCVVSVELCRNIPRGENRSVDLFSFNIHQNYENRLINIFFSFLRSRSHVCTIIFDENKAFQLSEKNLKTAFRIANTYQ